MTNQTVKRYFSKLGKKSAAKQKRTPEMMRQMALKRWGKNRP